MATETIDSSPFSKTPTLVLEEAKEITEETVDMVFLDLLPKPIEKYSFKKREKLRARVKNNLIVIQQLGGLLRETYHYQEEKISFSNLSKNLLRNNFDFEKFKAVIELLESFHLNSTLIIDSLPSILFYSPERTKGIIDYLESKGLDVVSIINECPLSLIHI